MSNAALKRTTVVLIALTSMLVTLLVSLVTTHYEGAYASDEEFASTSEMMPVSDRPYKTPVGVGITSKKATPETIAELEKAAAEAEIAPELETEAVIEMAGVENYETDWQPSEGYVYNEIVYYDPVEETWCDDGYEDTNVSYGDSGYLNANVDGAWIAGSDFMFSGVYQDSSGYSYTYYSENVLPGDGLDIPGRHVDDEGYVVDGDGNICIASDDLEKGTVVNVPFGDGTAVVYDCGSGYGNLDVYTAW